MSALVYDAATAGETSTSVRCAPTYVGFTTDLNRINPFSGRVQSFLEVFLAHYLLKDIQQET